MTTLDTILAAWGAAFQRPPSRAFADHEGTPDERVSVDGWVVYRCDAGWGLALEVYLPSYSFLLPPDLDLLPVGEWETLAEAVEALVERSAPHPVDPDAVF